MASAATLGAPGDALLGRFVRVQSSVRCRQDTESLPVHGRRGGLLWCSFPARAFAPCVARLRRRVTKPPGSRLTIHCAAQRHQVSEHVSAHAVLECASAACGTADRTKAGNGRTSTEGFADDSGRACRPHTRSPECLHCNCLLPWVPRGSDDLADSLASRCRRGSKSPFLQQTRLSTQRPSKEDTRPAHT